MTTKEMKTKAAGQLIGAYLVEGTAGNVGMPGAPIMHFSLVVVPSAHSVNGSVEITQALQPPFGDILIKNVTGTIRSTGFGTVTQVVALQGEYTVPLPAPAIGQITEKFSASMALDNSWNGTCSFSYGANHVDNVPVKKA